ncbi:hypothetical protein GCM10017608_02720 [Agromyces luteolus]|nr:hypothetical protein GCM10017608_02720 [Agromyces luteolus]
MRPPIAAKAWNAILARRGDGLERVDDPMDDCYWVAPGGPPGPFSLTADDFALVVSPPPAVTEFEV